MSPGDRARKCAEGYAPAQEDRRRLVRRIVSAIRAAIIEHDEGPQEPYRRALVQSIARNLTPDLLRPAWRGRDNPVAGHCYTSSEAFFHIAGGKARGFTPMFIYHEGAPHWWVRGPKGEVYDVTAGQFKSPVPYEKGVAKGFLTKQPSKRAKILMDRVK